MNIDDYLKMNFCFYLINTPIKKVNFFFVEIYQNKLIKKSIWIQSIHFTHVYVILIKNKVKNVKQHVMAFHFNINYILRMFIKMYVQMYIQRPECEYDTLKCDVQWANGFTLAPSVGSRFQSIEFIVQITYHKKSMKHR